ncbi:MAG: class I SAM-dependent methyltransferase [Simkaniaceae bacterium]|nr:class I SAM-dependent methyltransferase [Simkaniaceae bacterium]
MEINLLENYPKAMRNVKERGATKTEEDRKIARQFGREFFDGERKHGYGGFNYHPKFWTPVVPAFQKKYALTSESSLLDVGCAKGFMLHDFKEAIPGMRLRGIDISSYAIENAMPSMQPFLQVGNVIELPFEDRSFDLVIAINTIHNLEQKELIRALQEIQRVSRGHSFITVDAYHTAEEKELMLDWNLTAKTILHVEEWKSLFQDIGYTGDYYWFIP